jgi:hypothetical protein
MTARVDAAREPTGPGAGMYVLHEANLNHRQSNLPPAMLVLDV